MKVLVISCNTGGGHNSAGHALEEQLKKEGMDVRFLDMFSLSGEKLSKKVSDCYIFSTRSVSYTHLDVYKRQALSSIDFRNNFLQVLFCIQDIRGLFGPFYFPFNGDIGIVTEFL